MESDFRKNKNFKKYYPSSGEKRYKGVFRLHNTYGFIENTPYYVRYENMNTALHQDVVEYVLTKPYKYEKEQKSEYEAIIVSVLKRTKTRYTGEIIWINDNILVQLDNAKFSAIVVIPKNEKEKTINVGYKVTIELTKFCRENLEGKIVKVLGHKNDLNMDVVSILKDYDVKTKFPKEVKEEIKKINLDLEKYKKQSFRIDYTNIPLVTIDPENSKDFDDAIAVLEKGDNYLLYIAIADVWTYLKELQNTNKEAEKRTTSIYFLNSVIHMLPEKLSNDLCSLKPNMERCAIVMTIEIDKTGKVLWNTLQINPGIIESKRRFTYDEVNKYFKNKEYLKNERREVIESINLAYDLYKKLEIQRIKRGYITLKIPEVKLHLDENNEILDIYEYKSGEAQAMIENFMVLANEGIANFLNDRKIKTIYRIHENPDEEKIKTFLKNVKELNFLVKDDDSKKIAKKNIIKWLDDNKDNQFIKLIHMMLLRSMKKAKYSPKNIGHYGLSIENYLHFTSPIRRYPDLIVHRILWMNFFDKDSYPLKERKNLSDRLEQISDLSSYGEAKSSEIEKTIKEHKIIKFINRKLDEVLEGVVTGRGNWMVYIQITKYLIEGFVKTKVGFPIGTKLLVKPIYNKKEFKLIKKM